MECGRDVKIESSSVDVVVNQLELEDDSVERTEIASDKTIDQTVSNADLATENVTSDTDNVDTTEDNDKQNQPADNLLSQNEEPNQSADASLAHNEDQNQPENNLLVENNEDEDTQILLWNTSSEAVCEQNQSADASEVENNDENQSNTSVVENNEDDQSADEPKVENEEENHSADASSGENEKDPHVSPVDASSEAAIEQNQPLPMVAPSDEDNQSLPVEAISEAATKQNECLPPVEPSEETDEHGQASPRGAGSNSSDQYIQQLPTGVLSDESDEDEDTQVLSPDAPTEVVPEQNTSSPMHAPTEATKETKVPPTETPSGSTEEEAADAFPIQILPFVLRHLCKSHFLNCRVVSRSWKAEVDQLYENHITTFPSSPLQFLDPETNLAEIDYGFVINSSAKTERFLQDMGNHTGNPFPKRLVTILKSDEYEKDSEFWKNATTLLKRFGKQVYSLTFAWRTGGNEIEKCARLRNILQLLPNMKWLSIGSIPVKGHNQTTIEDGPKLYNFLDKNPFPCLPSLEEIQFYPSANIPELLVECLLQTHPGVHRLFGEYRKCATFCLLPELVELDVSISDCDSILLGSPMDVIVNPPLKKVTLKKSGFSIFFYETLFKWLRRFAPTLQEIQLVCKWMVFSSDDYVIVKLPHVKKFTLKCLNMETLEYLRGLQSLEHLVVESYSVYEWSEEAENVVKFLGYEETPNVWQLLPNLITVRYDGKISRDSKRQSMNFLRDGFLQHQKNNPIVPLSQVVAHQHEDGENTQEIDEEDLDTQLLFGEELEVMPKNATDKRNEIEGEVEIIPKDAGETTNGNEEEVDAMPNNADEKLIEIEVKGETITEDAGQIGNGNEKDVESVSENAEEKVNEIKKEAEAVVETARKTENGGEKEVEAVSKNAEETGNEIDDVEEKGNKIEHEVENAEENGNEIVVKVEAMPKDTGEAKNGNEEKEEATPKNAEKTGNQIDEVFDPTPNNEEEKVNEMTDATQNNEGVTETEIEEQVEATPQNAEDTETRIQDEATVMPKNVEEAEIGTEEQNKADCEHLKHKAHQLTTPASH